MKKQTMFIAAAALGIPAPLAFPTPSRAAGGEVYLDYCQNNVMPYYPGEKLGQCASLITLQNPYEPGFAPRLCEFELTYYTDFFYTQWDSYTDCIKEVQSEVGR